MEKEFINQRFSEISKGLLWLILVFIISTISGNLVEDYYFKHYDSFGEIMYSIIMPIQVVVVLLTWISLLVYGIIAIYNFQSSRKKRHLIYGVISISMFFLITLSVGAASAGGGIIG